MKLSSFHAIIRWIIIVAIATFASSAAAAWPNRPITLVVPYPPGGGADTIARYYADALSKRLGQSVVVTNKPGAGTALAAETVANAAPDGYTLSLAVDSQFSVLPHIYSDLRYKPFKDFSPVAIIGSVPQVIAANPQTGIDSIEELIQKAKDDPGAITFSSCGTASTCHLSGELFKEATGTDLLHIPYAGSAPAIVGLLGHQVDIAFDTLMVLAPQIQANKVNGLAILADRRSPLIPDVPTVEEAGLPELAVGGFYGIAAPANTPSELIDRLDREIKEISKLPETKAFYARHGFTLKNTGPEAFTRTAHENYERWGRIIKSAHITAQ